MSLALDTDVLIPWLVRSAPRHHEARAFIEAEIARDGGRIALAAATMPSSTHAVAALT